MEKDEFTVVTQCSFSIGFNGACCSSTIDSWRQKDLKKKMAVAKFTYH